MNATRGDEKMWPKVIVQFLQWLALQIVDALRRLGNAAATLALALCVIGLAAWIFVMYRGPVLVDAQTPKIVLDFPISEEVPDPKPNKLQILSQRKVFYISEWNDAADGKRVAHDVAHIVETYT
jgi:hypothetical protein